MSLILNGTDNTVGAPAVTGSTGGTGTGVYYPATNQVAVATNGVNAITVDANQKIGIGTTSPNSYGGLLNVVSTTAGSSKINISDWSAGASPAPLLQFGVNSSNGFVSTDAARVWATSPSSTTAALNFAAYNGGVPSTAQMTLTNGNVGIGTSSPTLALSVGVNAGVNGINHIYTGTGGPSNIATWTSDVNTGEVRFGGVLAGYFPTFYSSNTERMRIDTSGNLLVARTSSSRSARVSVLASNAVNDGIFVNGYGSGICNGASFSSASAVATAVEFLYNTTTVGAINTSTTATTYATSSDYRLKEDIAPMTGALETVSKLKPVTYTWIEDKKAGQGFIAHELQAVVPDCVTGTKDAVDEEGNPVYQGIDTSFLVATLTAAIQELKAEFDAYKATHP
jgi:hypothetical protein